MKSKKKQKKLRGQFLSGHALWAEVKHASELLQQSHFRAYSLYEDIADLQGSISDAVVHLEELVKATDEEDVNLEQQKKYARCWSESGNIIAKWIAPVNLSRLCKSLKIYYERWISLRKSLMCRCGR
jgi:hypothetical protein